MQVNKWGNIIYDEYVRPVDYVVDFRTQISGIRPRDLRKGMRYVSAVFESSSNALVYVF